MNKLVYIPLLVLALAGCKNSTKQNATTGVIAIAVDKSFQPIIQQEADVFESLYSLSGIVSQYVDEVSALNLLMKDSVGMIITTRGLSKQEMEGFHARKMFPNQIKIATDGIALIVHPSNRDTLISTATLRKILCGEITQWGQLKSGNGLGDIQLVFDHPSSSTVRYAIDSICKDKPLSKKLFAQQTPAEVVRYVSRTPGAIGMIGVNWIGNQEDTSKLSFSRMIRVMSVSALDPAYPSASYKPYQAYIALGQYPLCRDVYAILNDPRGGVASGFYTFLCSDRGQRIILKSGLVPATQPLRIVNTKTNTYTYD